LTKKACTGNWKPVVPAPFPTRAICQARSYLGAEKATLAVIKNYTTNLLKASEKNNLPCAALR
jgi:hypothetical protein